ncbi:hypothetical protein OGATHE_005891 [Ogataea polymorpha]|uniref:Uncharacterized protein n=1 Tax=Ogataea polymorpha TaxID=460523 RepID=A0A9P8NV69_9ASCO|nr:hypothetical protein OGATHE_005891 [Ogataea polymorpha]
MSFSEPNHNLHILAPQRATKHAPTPVSLLIVNRSWIPASASLATPLVMNRAISRSSWCDAENTNGVDVKFHVTLFFSLLNDPDGLVAADAACAPVIDTDTMRLASSIEPDSSRGSSSSEGLMEMITVDWLCSCFQIGCTTIGGLELFSMLGCRIWPLDRPPVPVLVLDNIVDPVAFGAIGACSSELPRVLILRCCGGAGAEPCGCLGPKPTSVEVCFLAEGTGGAGGSALDSRAASGRGETTGTVFWTGSGAEVGTVPAEAKARELVEPL